MAGVITINFSVIKKGMANLGLKSPIYIPGPVEPQFGPGRYIYFEGFSVDERGKQRMSFLPLFPPPPTTTSDSFGPNPKTMSQTPIPPAPP
jgi:hypothetical protein